MSGKSRNHAKRGFHFSFLSGSKSSIKLGFLALGILITAIILGKSISFIRSLGEPMNQDVLDQKLYSWNGKSSINIAVKTSSISVLNFDPLNKTIVILKIPNDTYFTLPKNYGSWPVGSIYELGQENNPPVGSELLKQSLSTLLGLPVDGFMTFRNSSDQQTPLDKTIGSWHNNPINMISSLKNIDTDLTPLEALSLMRALSSVRPDQIQWLDISQSNITTSKLLPDSTRVLGVDLVQLDLFVRANMADATVSRESIPVAIYNATTHPGLAQIASREITNMGGNVVFVSNTNATSPKTLLLASDRSTSTYSRLSQIFAPSCLNSNCQFSDPRVSPSLAQITIIIGEDFYSR